MAASQTATTVQGNEYTGYLHVSFVLLCVLVDIIHLKGHAWHLNLTSPCLLVAVC